MSFDFKTVIGDYCSIGKLSEEKIDFLEIEHIRTMGFIREILSPSIANFIFVKLAILKKEVLY